MRRQSWIALALLILLIFSPGPVSAGSLSLSVEPQKIFLSGAPAAAVSASLRLDADTETASIRLSMAELTCTDEANQPLQALPADQISIDPPFIEKLAPNEVTQVALTVTLPEKTGTCQGQLIIAWGNDPADLLGVPVTVKIATQPALAVQYPEKLILNGQQRSAAYLLDFVLKETAAGSPITDLKAELGPFSSPDALSLAAADWISVNLADHLPAGQTLSGTASFNLANIPAGTYEGQILFKSGGKFLAALPVTLNVRHPWWIAALVLGLGVALGLWLSFYKEKGRPRDLLIRRIADAKLKLNADPQLEQYFGPVLHPLLREAETRLKAEKFEEGTAAAAKVENALNRWEDFGRLNWIGQLEYLKNTLLPRLALETSGFGQKLLTKAQSLLENAAEAESPLALRDQVTGIEDLLAKWKTTLSRVDQIAALFPHLPAATQQEKTIKQGFETQARDLRDRLDSLSPAADDKSWADLDNDIQELLKDVQDYIQQHSIRIPAPLYTVYAAGWDSLALVEPDVPPALRQELEVTPAGARAARRRLTAWSILTYGLGGALLAVAGFSTVYLPNLTFGLHPVGDYAGLFLWGITGQAGFTVVADLVRGFGFPAFLK